MTTLSAPSPLRLDDQHRYWLAERELISVTAALKVVGLIEDEWFSDEATARGTYVHQACVLVDEGDLGYVEPACEGYVSAYCKFLTEAHPTWNRVEQGICDPVMGYAGTLDRAGQLNDKWIVLDIKTGAPAPWHGLQLAAYARLICDHGMKPARFDLYLRPDGTYHLEPRQSRADESLFFAALQLAQFRRMHGYRAR